MSGAQQFLTLLYEQYPPDRWLELRVLHPDRAVKRALHDKWYPNTPNGRAEMAFCANLLSEQGNVFHSVFPRSTRGGRHLEFITEVRFLYADIDGPFPDPLPHPLPPPALLVKSGRGHHGYWPLEPLAVHDDRGRERFRALQKRVIHLLKPYGADEVHDTARVLRPPDTLNHKTAPPRAVELMTAVDQNRWNPLSVEWCEKHLPTPADLVLAKPCMPSVRDGSLPLSTHRLPASPPTGAVEPIMPRATYAWITTPSAPGKWNQNALRIVVSLFKHGFSPEQARRWLWIHTQISGRKGPRYAAEIDRFIGWAQRRVFPDYDAIRKLIQLSGHE